MNKRIEEITKTGNKKCSRGWYEPEKNEEGKSKRHSEVAGRTVIKNDLRDTARTPMRKAPEIPEPEIEAEPEKRRPPFRIRNFFKKQDAEEETEEAEVSEDETPSDTDEGNKEEQEVK